VNRIKVRGSLGMGVSFGKNIVKQSE
jgi:hypothetical protein